MKRTDIYNDVTNIIAAALETGIANEKWEMPWHGFSEMPQNATTKKTYRGVNVPVLWVFQLERGYKSGLWATYRQWQSIGAQVRTGEKGAPIVFWKSVDIEPTGEDMDKQTRMFASHSSVFNADQVDGFELIPQEKRAEIILKDDCTRFVQGTQACIEHGHPYACYRSTEDKICLPSPDLFRKTAQSSATENYYSVLFHELTHWSGAKHRLNRINHKKHGDSDYAFEELVAELGAAMLCASLGATPCPRADHARYIKNWLQGLNNDKRLIFAASSQAQKAVDYLYGLQQSDMTEQQEQERAA